MLVKYLILHNAFALPSSSNHLLLLKSNGNALMDHFIFYYLFSSHIPISISDLFPELCSSISAFLMGSSKGLVFLKDVLPLFPAPITALPSVSTSTHGVPVLQVTQSKLFLQFSTPLLSLLMLFSLTDSLNDVHSLSMAPLMAIFFQSCGYCLCVRLDLIFLKPSQEPDWASPSFKELHSPVCSPNSFQTHLPFFPGKPTEPAVAHLWPSLTLFPSLGSNPTPP